MMLDVDIAVTVRDAQRRFDLRVAFTSSAPVVALYGPSGAGKSLTLQAIAGLLAPTAGHVRLGTTSVFDHERGIDLPVHARRVGYMFQNYALFPHLSVRDNVAFGLRSWRKRGLSKDDASRVDGVLESFGLTAMAGSRPSSLSGGQQQRVALARALVCQPAALLLDEPFAALNPMLRQSLREELAQVIARSNIPTVLVSHDIEDVLALAQVAFVLDEGQVVREVDLDRAVSRDVARRSLLPGQPGRPRRPDEQKLRAMLDVLDTRF